MSEFDCEFSERVGLKLKIDNMRGRAFYGGEA